MGLPIAGTHVPIASSVFLGALVGAVSLLAIEAAGTGWAIAAGWRLSPRRP